METATPQEALAEVQRLRRRAHRKAHGGAWFPALAVGVLLLGSIGLYRYPFASPNEISAAYPFWAGLPDQQRHELMSYVYWFVGAPVVFALTALWYRWRARRVGMRVSWRPFVLTGLGFLVLLAVLAALPTGDAGAPGWRWIGWLTPLLPVAAAVLALGWVERSPALIVAGGWIGLLALWLCSTFPLGSFPGWVDLLLNGGEGPGLGGQFALRPGHYVILMALPPLLFGLARLVKGSRD